MYYIWKKESFDVCVIEIKQVKWKEDFLRETLSPPNGLLIAEKTQNVEQT